MSKYSVLFFLLSYLGTQNLHSSSILKNIPIYPYDGENNAKYDLCKGLHCQNGGTPALFEFGTEDSNQCQVLIYF